MYQFLDSLSFRLFYVMANKLLNPMKEISKNYRIKEKIDLKRENFLL